MNITVNVDAITLASEIDGAYVQTGEEEWQHRPLTVGDLVADKIVTALRDDTEQWYGLKTRYTAIRDELIRETVAPQVAEAINKPLRITNSFGEHTGAETSLTELIVKEARESLNRKGDYGRGTSSLQDHITKAVEAAFTQEIADEVKKVRAAVGGAIGKTVSTEIQKAIESGLRGV